MIVLNITDDNLYKAYDNNKYVIDTLMTLGKCRICIKANDVPLIDVYSRGGLLKLEKPLLLDKNDTITIIIEPVPNEFLKK